MTDPEPSAPPAGAPRETPLDRAVEVLGDGWSVQIMREAFLGVRLFDDFQRRLAIPRQTLTHRLDALVAHGLLRRRPYQTRPLRHEYRLDDRGRDLHEYALLSWRWQQRWGAPDDASLPESLRHRSCGHAMQPVFACRACRRPVGVDDVEWRPAAPRAASAAAATPAPMRPATTRPTRQSVVSVLRGDAAPGHLGAFMVADRWTHRILAAGWRGVTTFDEFGRELGVAPNTLAQRLKGMVAAELLTRERDPDDSRRRPYRLSERARELFPVSMALARWAERWGAGPGAAAFEPVHRACGTPLHGVVLCSACAEPLGQGDVAFDGTPDGGRGAPRRAPLRAPRPLPAR